MSRWSKIFTKKFTEKEITDYIDTELVTSVLGAES